MGDTSERTSGRVKGLWAFALWIAAALAAMAGLGGFLDETVTGIVFEERSIGGAIAAVLLVLAAVLATIIWARGLGRGPEAIESGKTVSGRRRVLVGALATGGGLIASAAASTSASASAVEMAPRSSCLRTSFVKRLNARIASAGLS